MKQKLQNILFLFLLGTIGVNAQGPVITAAGFNPVIGDSYKWQHAKNIFTILDFYGQNKFWDFSNLIDSGSILVNSYVSPKGLSNADSFPSSDIALISSGNGSVAYLKRSDSGLGQVGYFGYNRNNDNAPFINKDIPESPMIHYPMSLNTSYTDSLVIYNIEKNVTSKIYVSDTLIGVGYGTLKLPKATYKNVLCIYDPSFWGGLGSYKFVVNGIHWLLILLRPNYSYVNGAAIITSWSVSYNSETPLQIDITSFTTSWQNKMPYLQWSATNTENTKTFNVQRSEDGNTFSNIGQVAANTASAFHFEDNYTPTITVYYRLQQVDKMGKFFYSNVTQLIVNRLPLTVAPNQARGAIHLMIPAESRVQVLIYNVAGKLVYENKNLTAADAITTNTWSKGTYMVRIKDNNGWQVSSFEKE